MKELLVDLVLVRAGVRFLFPNPRIGADQRRIGE